MEPKRIAGPVAEPSRPKMAPPAGAVDTHAHLFGPEARFPYSAGRGYTPPEAPLEKYLALLDRLGLARGVLVQGNAHGFDNRVLLDALERAPARLRAVAITDDSIPVDTLRDWHRLGMRGLRFHEQASAAKPGVVRGVSMEVLPYFRKVMRDLGWTVTIFGDPARLPAIEARLRDLSVDFPIIVDHMLNTPAAQGVNDPGFQCLLRLVGEGKAYAKVSGAYRVSKNFPDYPDARPFHDALLAANPERLLWGTDWPHTQLEPEVMPDDGHLLDLFQAWTPKDADRKTILVDNPARLFWGG